MREATSFCRLCAGKCAVVLTIDDDERIAAVSGDRANPTSEPVGSDLAVEPINGMPRFSAIPVDVLPG
jgi:hypothetical protein